MKEKEIINLPLRQKNILKMLLTEEDWIKGSRIASEMGITDRTVRNDIVAINNVMKNSSSFIESSRQKGYRLNSSDMQIINKIIFNDKNLPITPEERMRYLSIRLLQTDEAFPRKLDSLADEMAISFPTLESTIQKIKPVLENRKDPFVMHRKQGLIWTEGDEESRRFLLKELILDRSDLSYLLLSNYKNYFKGDMLEKIMECLIAAFKEFNCTMTDESMIHMVIFLAIKQMRISRGYTLTHKSEVKLVNDYNNNLSKKIAENMQDKLGLFLNEAEMLDLMVQLSLMRISIGVDSNHIEQSEISQKNHFMAIVDSLLKDIKEKFGLDLTNDIELRNGLCSHIKYIIKRKNDDDTKRRNPILDLLKTEYSFVFEMSLYLYDCFHEMFDVKLNEDELGYITAYLGAAIERLENQKDTQNVSVALVSNTNQSTNTLLTARIRSKFGNKVNIVGPYSAYSMDEIMENKPKAIITTASKFFFDDCQIPIVKISPMLNMDDLAAINVMIENIKNKSIGNPLPEELYRYFDEKVFFKGLEAKDRTDAISKMVDILYKNEYVPKEFLSRTLQREEISSTYFGNMLAMPHPVEACSNKTIISIGILDKPVKWGNNCVQVVFLLAIRKEDLKYIRHFFNITCELANDTDKVTRLINASNYEQVISILMSSK